MVKIVFISRGAPPNEHARIKSASESPGRKTETQLLLQIRFSVTDHCVFERHPVNVSYGFCFLFDRLSESVYTNVIRSSGFLIFLLQSVLPFVNIYCWLSSSSPGVRPPYVLPGGHKKGGCPPMAPMSVHDHDKYKNDRMRKKLGQQHRSKSECREYPEEEKDPSQPSSSQKSKKNEKVKKRQATVPSPNTTSLEKEASRTSSSFSCCQCHHPSTPTTDVMCRK